jgi:hypothetical protein
MARSTQQRELVNTGRDARYVKRAAAGTFTESDDVGRSQRADKRQRAKTTVASGFGDQGDRPTRARRSTKKTTRSASAKTTTRTAKRTAKKR